MSIDMNSLAAVVTAIAGAAAGHYNGKRVGTTTAVTVASQTVDMLTLQVNLLNEKNEEKERAIEQLTHRVDTLQELVTQRAAVEEVRSVVDKIATKVGA